MLQNWSQNLIAELVANLTTEKKNIYNLNFIESKFHTPDINNSLEENI